MSKAAAPMNSNVVDTDFINLGDIKLNLNNLEIAKVVKASAGYEYGLLFMKNGGVHTVEKDIIDSLNAYCR